MNDFKIKISLFLITPFLIVILFYLTELLFLNFHLGEGKIWGTDRKNGYYKVIPFGMINNHSPFEDFPSELKPTINSKGFRNREFTKLPQKNTLRIICLGESSTFGFHNSDSQTYPYQLDVHLKQKFKSKNIEVINAGVPMINIEGMKNLLKHEVIHYKPDIITLYTSYNDVIDSTYSKNLISYLYNYLYKHTEFGVWISRNIKNVMRRYKKTGQKFLPKIDEEEVNTSLKSAKDFYFSNLKEIVEICKKNEIKLIVIKQPTGKPQNYLNLNKEFLKLSYQDKKNYYKNKLSQKGYLNILESKFYIQRELSKALEIFISQHSIKLIDFTNIANKHLEWFAGPVHLNAKGNKNLAKFISNNVKWQLTK